MPRASLPSFPALPPVRRGAGKRVLEVDRPLVERSADDHAVEAGVSYGQHRLDVLDLPDATGGDDPHGAFLEDALDEVDPRAGQRSIAIRGGDEEALHARRLDEPDGILDVEPGVLLPSGGPDPVAGHVDGHHDAVLSVLLEGALEEDGVPESLRPEDDARHPAIEEPVHGLLVPDS